MPPYSSGKQARLRTVRRLFGLIPLLVFLVTLILLAPYSSHSSYGFAQLLLRSLATTLASTFVCVAAYGFYRFLLERSAGL